MNLELPTETNKKKGKENTPIPNLSVTETLKAHQHVLSYIYIIKSNQIRIKTEQRLHIKALIKALKFSPNQYLCKLESKN